MPRLSIARAQVGVRDTPFHSCWPTFDATRVPERDASGAPRPTSYLHRFDFGVCVINLLVAA